MKKLLTLTLALTLLLSACAPQAAPAETPEAATVSTVVRTEVVYPLPAPAELVGLARVGDALVVAGDDGGRGAALGRRRRGGLFLCPDRRGARLAAERLARDHAQ